MSSPRETILVRELRSTLAATFDLVVAAVYLALIVGLPFVAIDDITGGLFHARTVHLMGRTLYVDPIPLVVAIVAFGGSYPFVAEPRLLDRLGDFVWTLLFSLSGVAVVVLIPLFVVGGVPGDSTVAAVVPVAVVAGGYAVAIWSQFFGDDTA